MRADLCARNHVFLNREIEDPPCSSAAKAVLTYGNPKGQEKKPARGNCRLDPNP